MFRKIRRKEKQLTLEECNLVIAKAEYGTIATMGADGYPYAVPVNHIFHKGNIYFHCATVGHKLDNIYHCSNVSFNIVTDAWTVPLIPEKDSEGSDLKFKGFDSNFNSVTIFGKAIEVFEDEKMNGLIAFLKRFLSEKEYNKYETVGIKYIKKAFDKTKLIKIEIVHMTGKRGIRQNKEIQGIKSESID